MKTSGLGVLRKSETISYRGSCTDHLTNWPTLEAVRHSTPKIDAAFGERTVSTCGWTGATASMPSEPKPIGVDRAPLAEPDVTRDEQGGDGVKQRIDLAASAAQHVDSGVADDAEAH